MLGKKAKNLNQEHKIDWNLIHQQLDAANARLQQSDRLSQQELEAIWARRAAQLATEIAQDDLGEQLELVIVQIGQEHYGLEVGYVYDIRPLGALTRIPRVPTWVAGVVNLRGRIISVLNLAIYLGLGGGETSENTQPLLMLVETPQMELALLVDDVLSVEPVSVGDIQEAAGSALSIPPEYLRGLVVRSSRKDLENGDMLMILNLPALLADRGLIVHEEAA